MTLVNNKISSKEHISKRRPNIKCAMKFSLRICVAILKTLLNIKLSVLLMTLPVICLLVLVVLTWRSIDDYNFQPVIIWWSDGFPGTNELRECSGGRKCYVSNDKNAGNNAAAYLFYGSNIDFENLPLPRKPYEILWGLYHEESPRNTELLLHDPLLNLFNYSATFSRYSDIPFTLQHLDHIHDITSKSFYVETSVKNILQKEISPIMFLQTDCATSTERDEYVKEVMKYIDVDSYGGCLNNKELPDEFKHDYLNNMNNENFLRFIARYKFVIAIENAVCEDYITEKLWRALQVGTVPIYFGSPSIRDWLPNPKSAILVQDFKTPADLVKHMKVLMNNDTLYEEYLEHKLSRLISNERLIQEYKDVPWVSDALKVIEKYECLICDKLHDKHQDSLVNKFVVRKHYDCPQPISALSLKVNNWNPWVQSYQSTRKKAYHLCEEIMKTL